MWCYLSFDFQKAIHLWQFYFLNENQREVSSFANRQIVSAHCAWIDVSDVPFRFKTHLLEQPTPPYGLMTCERNGPFWSICVPQPDIR